MSEFKIEKGIPLPLSPRMKSGSSEAFRSMDEGDSVFFTDRRMASRFAAHGHMISRNTEWTARQRKVDGGFRVWKIKREPKPNGSPP